MESDKWNLNVFYDGLDDERLAEDIKLVLPSVEAHVEKYKGKVANFEAKDFIDYFEDKDKISRLTDKIEVYLHLLESLETQNQEVKKKSGEFENIQTEVSSKLIFFSQELKQLGYERLLDFSKDSSLKDYQNYFFSRAQNVKYILDEATEKALNIKSPSGATSFDSLYGEYVGSFKYDAKIGGEIKTVTFSELSDLKFSQDEADRIEFYRVIRDKFSNKQTQIVLGKTYNSLVKNWTSEVKLRGYKSPMTIRNISNQLDDDVVDVMLDEIHNSYPLYQRYLSIKKKLMGKEKFMLWDISAPVFKDESEFSFEKTKKLYFDVIKDFDNDFFEYSKDMLNGRVDAFPREGKRDGAFNLSTKWTESFVLLNHTNTVRDAFTFSHELGHAVHGKLCQVQKNQVYYKPIALAETASIFNEVLFGKVLLAKLNDEQKKSLLETILDETFGTIFRQVQYTLFEKKVHEKILGGEELTYVDFNNLWRDELKSLYGSVVEFDVESSKDSGWSMIPHIFHWPFYCYSYSFGNLLGYSLYEKYEQSGKSFVKEYKDILASGGSERPYDLLIKHGIDIKDKEFYKSGLKVLEGLVDEFENSTR